MDFWIFGFGDPHQKDFPEMDLGIFGFPPNEFSRNEFGDFWISGRNRRTKRTGQDTGYVDVCFIPITWVATSGGCYKHCCPFPHHFLSKSTLPALSVAQLCDLAVIFTKALLQPRATSNPTDTATQVSPHAAGKLEGTLKIINENGLGTLTP